jgi:ubiquinone/menaquinone biosynthesis C-methylase UbiE
MESTTALYQSLPKPTGYLPKLSDCFVSEKNKTISSWTVEQLRIQPYQHILEIGYGSGNTLYETARKLQTGFIAGIDESITRYQQAFRKNKKFIQQQLMQLHLGFVEDLPYPAHYFNSIYANNIYLSWKEPEYKFMQLSKLLKSGGKLITVFQPRGSASEEQVWDVAEKIQQQYIDAGLTDVRISFRDTNAASAVAAVAYKP